MTVQNLNQAVANERPAVTVQDPVTGSVTARRSASEIQHDMGDVSRNISYAMFVAREQKHLGQDVRHWVAMAREASRQYVRLLADLKATGEYVDWGCYYFGSLKPWEMAELLRSR